MSEPRVVRYYVPGSEPAKALSEDYELGPFHNPTNAEFLERLDATHCRSGCPTQDHGSYGECLKDARFGVSAGETAKGQYT